MSCRRRVLPGKRVKGRWSLVREGLVKGGGPWRRAGLSAQELSQVTTELSKCQRKKKHNPKVVLRRLTKAISHRTNGQGPLEMGAGTPTRLKLTEQQHTTHQSFIFTLITK